MLRNPRMLRIKYETGVKVAFVIEITHFSSCNRLKSANGLLTNFYLTRKQNMIKPFIVETIKLNRECTIVLVF